LTTGLDVSLVVPTRDRGEQLRATLAALSGQTFPSDRIEVIVVDDGSADATPQIVGELGRAVYVRQGGEGPTAARNAGAARARAELLVFLDDDVELEPGAVASLVEAHRSGSRLVVVGDLETPAPAHLSEVVGTRLAGGAAEPATIEIPFTRCRTGLLSVGRAGFFSLGGFVDPTGGWPSWDDVDFGYRAGRNGFRLVCATSARGIHRCEWATSLDGTARRWYEASRSAVRLFDRYPGIDQSFPIYRDKLPIRWQRDSRLLVARKLARALVSSRLLLCGCERLAGTMAARGWAPWLTQPLTGCVISGYQWRGIRRGIRERGLTAGRPSEGERPAR
jgi:glycosyltransferase involved in cell wall biosynthesis